MMDKRMPMAIAAVKRCLSLLVAMLLGAYVARADDVHDYSVIPNVKPGDTVYLGGGFLMTSSLENFRTLRRAVF
jgi:hypothetical protein